jgi:hypothetical protein
MTSSTPPDGVFLGLVPARRNADMIFLAAVAAAALSLPVDLGTNVNKSHAPEAQSSCRISTVSYRFTGEPGTVFRYAGGTYTVPARGWIELIAGRPSEYEYAGKKLPLDVWPRDEMGMRSVPLPHKDAPPTQVAANATN